MLGVFAVVAASVGCVPRPVQLEVGTPTARFEGQPLVLLPRPCLVHRSVPDWHFGNRIPGPSPTETTLGLRRAIDTLVGTAMLGESGGVPDPARDSEACESPPALDLVPSLDDYRASESALRLMRDRGASSIVVLEVHTVMACARAYGSPLLAFYASTLATDAAPSFVPRDVCLEDDITVTAFVFGDDGVARWALTRDVHPGDPVEHAVDSVLERVPVTMLKRPRAAIS